MIARLHAAPLHLQVLLMLAAAPTVVALFGLSLAPPAVEIALTGQERDVVVAVEHAVRVAVGIAVMCAVLAAISAAVLLRGSIRAVVERMHGATEAIADGELRHRIASRRSDELGRLADGIDTMAERLERLEQARRRMLACVSHELRTPLTIVRGHAYTLARGETDPVRRARFELVDAEAVRLTALVDELIEAASLHAGGVRLERSVFHLVDAAHAVAARFAVEAGRRSLAIDVSTRVRVTRISADRARIDQVLGNLVANAVRHATPGTAIALVVHRCELSGSLLVDVENHGVAVPDELVERLFEPFEQHGDARGRIGLGLAIASDLCVAHGGSVTLHDAGTGVAGRPVRFRVSLPIGAMHRVGG